MKWSGKIVRSAKVYPTSKNGCANDDERHETQHLCILTRPQTCLEKPDHVINDVLFEGFLRLESQNTGISTKRQIHNAKLSNGKFIRLDLLGAGKNIVVMSTPKASAK